MTLSKKQLKQKRQILEKMYAHGPISRIDLSKNLHITPATVSDITSVLINERAIEEVGLDPSDTNVGRRKILLSNLPKYTYYLGVELTQEYITLAATDNLGEVINQTIQYNEENVQTTPKKIIQITESFIQNLGDTEISGLGIAIPGYYDSTARVIQTDNPFWNQFNIGQIMDYFPFEVYCKNKVNCMAIGLRYFNNGDGENDNFTLFHLRSGISCAYMYNGNIYGEHNPHVGEIGHVTVDLNGTKCQCGNNGCLQTYIGQSALIDKAKKLYHLDNSILNTLVEDADDVTLKEIILAYELGDSSILALIDLGLDALTKMIHNTGMIIDAYHIYIHGILFTNEHIRQRFFEKLGQNKDIFSFSTSKTYDMLPYDIYDGAIGACALSLYNDLLVG